MIIRCQGNRVIVEQATVEAARALRSRLSLPNPRYDGAVRAGKTPFGIPRMLEYYSANGDHSLILPGACGGLAAKAAELAGERWSLDSDLLEHRPIRLDFAGNLRLYQVLATADLTRYDHGILYVPTGGGKTIMALSMIAERAQPTMVVVPTKKLQGQWVRDCHKNLRGLACGDIGTVGGDDWGPGRCITIGVYKTVAERGELDRYGHIVIDEAHHVPSPTYLKILGNARARYRTGLDATPWRRDGLGEVIKFQLGRLITVERGPLVRAGYIMPIDVIQIPTAFETQRNASEQYQAVLGDLVADRDRNALIADRVRAQGGVVLVLSDRVEHCEELARLCDGVPLHGQQRAGARGTADEAIEAARDGRAVVLCATTQLIGEGFDLPAADTLAIATPIKFDGRLIQALGRVLRPAPGKVSGRILDFCDWGVGVLAAGAKARAKVYRNIEREEES